MEKVQLSWQNYSCKIHLIWGSRDSEVSREDIHLIQGYFRDIDFKEVKDGTHGLVLEFPEVVADFIDSCIGSESS